MPTDDHSPREGDAAAFVLGDLHGQELSDFVTHLATCPVCRDEVELLQQASDAVPLLASQPQKDPEDDPELELRSDPPIRPGTWAEQRVATVTTPRKPTPAARRRASPGRDPNGWWQQRVPRPVIALFGLLAVIGAAVVALTKQGSDINYVDAQIAWSKGAAVLKMDASRGQLLVERMPQPPAGDAYELWGIRRGVKTEFPLKAWLDVNQRGEDDLNVPGDVRTYLALVVYAEPAGGTRRPTGRPYVVADLRAVNGKTA